MQSLFVIANPKSTKHEPAGAEVLLDDWELWAKSSEDKNVLHFNLDNERAFYRGASGGPSASIDLPPHIREFRDYLAATADPPTEALRNFSKRCSGASRAGPPLTKPRSLAGIKGYGSARRQMSTSETEALGLSSAECNDGRTRVENIIRDVKASRPVARDLSDDEKRSIGKIIREKFAPSRRVTAAARAATATPTLPGATVIPKPAPDPELMWVTCRDTLDKACSPPTDPTDTLLGSAHLTEIRRELGVFGAYDLEGDLPDDPASSMEHIGYRILLKFELKFEDSTDLKEVRQPNMFSGGFEDLFVSRKPSSGADDMPGRTVRLVDMRCDHGGLDVERCARCGGVGLPEAVVPRRHAFDRGKPSLLAAHVAFSSDLRRYRPPTPAMIRQKNPPT